ncbi:MAG: TonB-dependent receptor [Bryobacteraceae bacterium]
MQNFTSKLIVIFALGCVSLWGQSTAQIHGTVQDASGAAVPGAEVKATQTETSLTRTTVSGADGGYLFTNLPIGPYRIEVSKDGFSKYAQSGLVLQVNADPTVDVALKVGAVTEQVNVEANANLVETRSATVGQVVENQRILELPLNGRDATSLITLAGAAVTNGAAGDRNGGGVMISVGGGFSFGVEYSLDGANHRNFITGASMPLPFPDALQEFKVETTGTGASKGTSSSVGAVTKSGTNSLHGDLFEFIRNDLTNANFYNILSAQKSSFKRNQFGGVIGGAIKKDKLFYFAGYQRTTQRSDPGNNEAFIPTPAILQGDWTAFSSTACGNTVRNPTGSNLIGGGFSNGRIDVANYSPAAVSLANRLLAQSTPDACGRVAFGARNVRNEDMGVGRMDYQLSDRQSVFGRYMASHLDLPHPYSFGNNLLNTNNDNILGLNTSVTIGDTYVVSPAMVNALRVSYNRNYNTRYGVEFFSACDLGVNFYCGYAPKRLGLFTVANQFVMGSNSGEQGQKYVGESFQLNDDVSFVKGAHQFSFGGNALLGRYHQTNHFVSSGAWTFNNTLSGNNLSDMMLGRLSTLNAGNIGEHYIRQWGISLYANDTWKINQRLTLNWGVRWEPYITQTVPNGRVYAFDWSRFSAGTKSNVFLNAPAGLYYPGDQGFPGENGINNRWNQYAPRVGLAWDPFGDGKTSIRASYTYGYNFQSGQWRLDASGSAPWGNRTNVTGVSFDNPWGAAGSPFPYTLDKNAPFAPFALFNSVRYDVRTPTTSAWSFGIQRQMGSEWLVSATYLGNETSHMWTLQPINPALIVPNTAGTAIGTCPAGVTAGCNAVSNTNQRRRSFLERPADGAKMSAIADTDDGGSMSYNAMLLSIQRRFSHNYSASFNYTLSHCIGDYADLNSQGPQADATYTNPNSRRFDRGNCDTDRRHLFNLTSVAQTPRFGSRPLRMVASDWKFSGIYRYISGSPLNVVAGADRALNGSNLQRVNLVDPNAYGPSSAALGTYLQRTAFATPALGTLGNLARNAYYGPGVFTIDMSVSRNFRLTEAFGLEIRGEAFNLTNSFRPGNPNVTLTSGQFGQIRSTAAGDFGLPRILQFSMKFTF